MTSNQSTLSERLKRYAEMDAERLKGPITPTMCDDRLTLEADGIIFASVVHHGLQNIDNTVKFIAAAPTILADLQQAVGVLRLAKMLLSEPYSCLGRDYWPDKRGCWQRLGEGISQIDTLLGSKADD